MGVGLSVDAIVGAVVRRMHALGVRAVYIATDGALRGEAGCELIREVRTSRELNGMNEVHKVQFFISLFFIPVYHNLGGHMLH